jgi:hypothetical protein
VNGGGIDCGSETGSTISQVRADRDDDNGDRRSATVLL